MQSRRDNNWFSTTVVSPLSGFCCCDWCRYNWYIFHCKKVSSLSVYHSVCMHWRADWLVSSICPSISGWIGCKIRLKIPQKRMLLGRILISTRICRVCFFGIVVVVVAQMQPNLDIQLWSQFVLHLQITTTTTMTTARTTPQWGKNVNPLRKLMPIFLFFSFCFFFFFFFCYFSFPTQNKY